LIFHIIKVQIFLSSFKKSHFGNIVPVMIILLCVVLFGGTLMEKVFDLLVIGSGVAGSNIALECAGAGLDTAIVDYRPYGGTCAMRGCDPKKILVDAAGYIDLARRLPQLVSSSPRISWQDLLRFKASFTDKIPQKREKAYRQANITALRGKASFVSREKVLIDGTAYRADKIVIATGAKPQRLGIQGEELLLDSDEFLELEDLPESMAFVGGGYISFEFAHIAKRFCKQVHIIHEDESPLNVYDQDIVRMLIDLSRDCGIEIELGKKITKIEKSKGRFNLGTADKVFSAELAVHGAGRAADVGLLDLEAAGITQNDGIEVNEYMQSTSNERIYAAGDAVSGSPLLTPVASYEARIAAYNIINGNRKKRELALIPSTLFTIPPLGSVGLTEEEAKDKGIDYKIFSADTSDWYHSRKSGYLGTGFKVLVDKDSGLFLGAHILGPGAQDIINLVCMAMNASLKAVEVKKMLLTYPSITSDLKYMV
jgi:glutathione reductase (NADPH)